MRAWREVMPSDVRLFPVGGVGSEDIAAWHEAGAAGFGIGSAIYRRGDQPGYVRSRAEAIASAWVAVARTSAH